MRRRAKGIGRGLQEELVSANTEAGPHIEIVVYSLTRFRSDDYLSHPKFKSSGTAA